MHPFIKIRARETHTYTANKTHNHTRTLHRCGEHSEESKNKQTSASAEPHLHIRDRHMSGVKGPPILIGSQHGAHILSCCTAMTRPIYCLCAASPAHAVTRDSHPCIPIELGATAMCIFMFAFRNERATCTAVTTAVCAFIQE